MGPMPAVNEPTAPPPGFADVLRTAVEERGLGLDRLREHLEQRGVSISVATLSYWQTGRSRPERRSSLEALPHLEEVLGLPHGSLHEPLTVPAQRRRRRPVQDLEAVWPEESRTAVLSRLDTRWDAELDRVSVHDRLWVGPDGRQQSLVVRQVLRARTEGPDRCVVMHCQDDVAVGLPAIRALRGCTPGRTAEDAATGVVATELLFGRALRPGQTVVIEYETVPSDVGPHEPGYSRRLRLPATEYLLEVHFSADAVPACVEAVRSDGTAAALEPDPEHGVHLVVGPERAGSVPGSFGIRWAWDGCRSEA